MPTFIVANIHHVKSGRDSLNAVSLFDKFHNKLVHLDLEGIS